MGKSDGVGASSNGYIKYDVVEGAAPGLKVVNNADPDPDGVSPGSPVENCIMAAGSASCNSEFQSGKRFKLDRTAYEPIDLVFDLGTGLIQSESAFDTYKVFQKYGNNTDTALGGFSIGLGFGIGDNFISSSESDGLGFVNFGTDAKNNEFSSLFAQGLFGPADDRGDDGRPRGYFSGERSGFTLDLINEDLFKTDGLFGGDFGYEALFGDWMSYSMTPQGYFYDDDGDPLTDAILMAHFDETSGKWIMNRNLDGDGSVLTVAEGNNGTQYDSVTDVEAALQSQASNLTLQVCSDPATGDACLAGIGQIEDLAKFNVTYFVDPLSFDDFETNSLAYTTYNDKATFTLRITAQKVPEPGILALFAAGFGLLAGRRLMAFRRAPSLPSPSV